MEEVKGIDCLSKLSQALKEAKAELQKAGFDLSWEFHFREYQEPVSKRFELKQRSKAGAPANRHKEG